MQLYVLKLKTLLRDRPLIFWTIVFPLALTLIFHFVFQNIKNVDDFETIKVGYVSNNFGENEINLINMMGELNYENRDVKLFSLSTYSLEEGMQELDDSKITALIDFDNNKFIFYTKESSIYATITKSVVDEYIHATGLIYEMVAISNGTTTPEEAFNKYISQANYVKKHGNTELDVINIYFYSVIAMTLMYGSILGLKEAVLLQPNYLPASKRIAMSRFSKSRLFLTSLAATFTVQLVQMTLFLIFVFLILKIPAFNIGLTLLLVLLGMVMSSVIGYSVAFIFNKTSISTKIGILTGITMFGSFLAGMMVAIVKYYISKYLPPLAYINPTNLISDGLYSLSYGNHTKYWINMASMIILSTVLIVIAFIKYRRDDYESI